MFSVPRSRARAALLTLGFVLFGIATLNSQAAEPKKILLVHSYGRETAPFDAFVTSFRTEMLRAWPEKVAFYDFSLETGRPGPGENEGALVQVLRARFGDTKLDFVVVLGAQASRFYTGHREELFPAVPTLVVADRRTAPVAQLKSSDSIVGIKTSGAQVISGILELLPETTTIAVIFGSSPGEQFWANEFRKEFAPFENRVTFVWLTDLPLSEVRKRIATLGPGAVALYGLFQVDAAGIPYEQDYAIGELHAASKVPMFGFFESQVGQGMVGGALISGAEVGVSAARTASRVLSGELPKDPVTFLGPTAPQFDWRELRRWNIDETRLPPGSVVRFRPPSIWEEHQFAMITSLGLLLLQAALITALILQRTRRQRAERESFALSWRLLTAHEDERRRLARELHDDVTQRLARLAIDATRFETIESRAQNPSQTVHSELVRLSEDVHALSYRLHPSILDDLGLAEALKAECEHVSRREPVRVQVDLREVPEGLPNDVALCIFRVAQEAFEKYRASRQGKCCNRESRAQGWRSAAGDTRQRHRLRHRRKAIEAQPRARGHGRKGKTARRRLRHQERIRAGNNRIGVGAAQSGVVMSRARVLLADDHRMVAEALKSLLETEFELLAVVEDGRQLVETARRVRPDVIVADITMPHLNGIDALTQMKHDNPDVRVVFLTMHKDAAYARRALEAGARGYVLKHSAPAELVLAVRAALEGKTFITPTLAGEVFHDLKLSPTQPNDPVAVLTPRQREILQLFAEGFSTKEIASRLDISTRTVEFHKYQLMDSLKLQSSAELIHFAIKNGIVTV